MAISTKKEVITHLLIYFYLDPVLPKLPAPRSVSFNSFTLVFNSSIKAWDVDVLESISVILSYVPWNGNKEETVGEISDLIFHLFVMMANEGIAVEDVMAELDKRSNKTGNLKVFHQVDKNT